MSQILAPVRRLADKTLNRRATSVNKALGKIGGKKIDRLSEEGTRINKQGVAASAPVFTAGGEAGEGYSILRDPVDVFGEQADRARAEADAAAAAKAAADRAAIRPLPDEEEIRRMKRKKAARAGSTGRSSTIFSDDYGSDSLGG